MALPFLRPLAVEDEGTKILPSTDTPMLTDLTSASSSGSGATGLGGTGIGGAPKPARALAPGPLVPAPPAANPKDTVQIVQARAKPESPKPVWHPPWKLMRVISGHEGWVRCLAVDP